MLELYMLGLIVQDMGKSLEFYRQLGLAIPEGNEEQTHVEIKMGSGLLVGTPGLSGEMVRGAWKHQIATALFLSST